MTQEMLTQISTAVIAAASAWIVARYTLVRSAKKDASDRQELRDREAQYLAIRVICQLDPFIYACCRVAVDNGRAGADGLFEPTTEASRIALPEDVDWRCLDPDLMYRVLSFPNDIEAANHSISSAMEYAATSPDFSEYFLVRRKRFAQLGLCASALADDLRRKFTIPEREDEDGNPEAHLNRALSQAFRDELLASPEGDYIRQEEAKRAGLSSMDAQLG